jgi:hypothetical protein
MVVTGWFTSEVGMRDLGYKGNIPNVWDGVPEDVLKIMMYHMTKNGFLDVLINLKEMILQNGMKMEIYLLK